MEKRNVYIIVAVVLVAALVVAFVDLTGKSVLGKCIDSDGGDKPLIPGSTSFTDATAVYKDECYAEGNGPKKYVREYFCLDKTESNRYFCETGCLENANGEGYCTEEGGANLITEKSTT